MTKPGVSTKGDAPLKIIPATAVSVHDGDTFRVSLPLQALWPEMVGGVIPDIRLAHVNAAELSTTEGRACAAAVKALLADPSYIVSKLLIWGRDKYGRVVGDLLFSDGSVLSDFVARQPGTVPMAVQRQISGAD